MTHMTRFGVPGALLPAVIPIAETGDRPPDPIRYQFWVTRRAAKC